MATRQCVTIGVVVVLAGLITCGLRTVAKQRIGPSGQPDVGPPGLRAVLVLDQAKWERGKPLSFLVIVVNGTARPLRLDNRMMWPGNVFLWVRLPGGFGSETGAETVRPSITRPQRGDNIVLAPGRVSGFRMTLDHRDPMPIPALRKPVAGRYSFRVVYYSPTSGVEITSNAVSITLR